MAKPKWRQILLSLTAFSNVASKEGKLMSCACSVFSEEDGCMQLFTYGIRKIIVRLVMVVFFAFSVRVVLMKSTEDEGISTMPTVKF